MASGISFSDDGSDISQETIKKISDSNLTWLPKEAVDKHLQAVIAGITEAEHNFPNGPRKFLKLSLRVRWNAITYQSQMALWSKRGAIPLLRALDIKTINVDTEEALNKPFTIKFKLNQKGYPQVDEVLPEDHQSHPQKTTPGKPSSPADDDEVPF